MLKFIICGLILGILLRILSNTLNNLSNNINNAIKKKETQRREELRQQELEQQEEFRPISYSTLYKGANTLKGNRYKFFAKIAQVEEKNIYYAYMQKYLSGGAIWYYYNFCILIYIIGTPSEILMEGDIVSFIGEVCGNYNKIPYLIVDAETLNVICSE